MPDFIGRPIPESIPFARVSRAQTESNWTAGEVGEIPNSPADSICRHPRTQVNRPMRFICFVAYLIGFRRILLLMLVLMAIAIAQHHNRCVTAVSPPTRPNAAAR